MRDLIDFHSHILPGIDDGSADLSTSLSMLQQEAAHGVGQVVLTPHFYPERDDPERFLRAREQAAQQLREACTQQELPRLHLGAEVAYFRGMSESDCLKELCIEHTNYILVELPMSQWEDRIYRELGDIREKQGLNPVVAHVDRYFTWFGNRKMIERLLEQPVLLQVNAGAFLRRSSAGQVLRLLDQGLLHMLGSDCHDLAERAPNLGAAAAVIAKKLGECPLQRLSEIGASVLPETVTV